MKKIILFAAPGIMGPLVFVNLFNRNREKIVYLVVASSTHAVSTDEILSIADRCRIPVLMPTDLEEPEFVQKIKSAEPDLILVASYDKKIPRKILDIPKIAAVNAHPSLLPKYRGACPEFWAIRNGERETGVTLHDLAEEFDAGDILLQEKLAISHIETLGSLLYRAAELSSNLLATFLDHVDQNLSLPTQSQDESQATRAPLVNATHLQIDWQAGVSEIFNLVRAANPLGGAWSLFRQSHLKMWYLKPYVLDSHDEIALSAYAEREPGQLIPLEEKRKLLVQAGDGLLEICVLQFALYVITDGWNFYVNFGLKKEEVLGEVPVGATPRG